MIATIAAVSIFYEPDDGLEIKGEKGNVIKSPTERNWMNNAVGTEYELHSDIQDSVFRAVIMKRFNNYLYIGDYSNMSFKRFTLDGNYVDQFGKGKGRGPGEFIVGTDFTVSDDNFFYVIDIRKKELMKFDNSTTEYITSSTVDFDASRITSSAGNIIIQGLMQENIFKIMDEQGNLVREFGTIIDDQLINSLSLSGRIEAFNNNGEFIYVPRRASYIFFYDDNGDKLRTIHTIDRIAFERSNKSKVGDRRMVRAPQSKVQTEDIDIHDNKIYLSQLTIQEDSSLPKSFLDVYELNTGKYLHSVKLPVVNGDVVVSDSRLYLQSRETEKITAYAYNHPQ